MTFAPATLEDARRPESRYYHPHGCAADLFRDRRPEVLLSGPAGTGKSRACLEKLHVCASKYAGMRGLIVRATRESLTESALVTFEEKVLLPNTAWAANTQRRLRQSYVYPNGSVLVVAGLDKPGKAMSTEYDMAYVQEAIELHEDAWEKITTRLRNGVMPYQQLLADTNPDRPTHWLKLRCDRGQTALLESRHEDNPTLWRRGDWTAAGRTYISVLDALTGARKPRLRYGRWVQAEGVVYDGWDAAVHLIDTLPAGWEDWPRYRSTDFGFSNPFCMLWGAVDPDGRLYIYRELYHTQRTVKRHAAQIRDVSSGESYVCTVADHDAEDRETLREEGIPTVPARKEISPGIQAVQERLQPAGDGKPRLFVLRSALIERDQALEDAKRPYCLAQEFDAYVWPKGADGKALKEKPVDADNHGLDALRYLVMRLGRKTRGNLYEL